MLSTLINMEKEKEKRDLKEKEERKIAGGATGVIGKPKQLNKDLDDEYSDSFNFEESKGGLEDSRGDKPPIR